ncbi:hypothetical protein AGMMS49992_03280 [Clostridia bacterium]|nr:hypothetical protein AGMMS49992_03280 [Clostridia bacterium]
MYAGGRGSHALPSGSQALASCGPQPSSHGSGPYGSHCCVSMRSYGGCVFSRSGMGGHGARIQPECASGMNGGWSAKWLHG